MSACHLGKDVRIDVLKIMDFHSPIVFLRNTSTFIFERVDAFQGISNGEQTSPEFPNLVWIGRGQSRHKVFLEVKFTVLKKYVVSCLVVIRALFF